MINSIASTGAHTADICAPRQNRAKQTEPAQEASVETGKTQKAAHPAHPQGHVPPGLARAAENIASKLFTRADRDGSGTVTQEELSTIHSRHARTLASSELFQVSPDVAANTTVETADTTEAATNTAITEATTEAPIPVGVTEAQLKEALAKSFYAKVGVRWTPPSPPTAEPSTSSETANPTVPSGPLSLCGSSEAGA